MNSRKALTKQKKACELISKIDMQSAKLNYEIEVLEDKLREIEEFVDAFCHKVLYLCFTRTV